MEFLNTFHGMIQRTVPDSPARYTVSRTKIAPDKSGAIDFKPTGETVIAENSLGGDRVKSGEIVLVTGWLAADGSTTFAFEK